nr:hypothetical protein [Microctonus hyperodae filamentous virus]
MAELSKDKEPITGTTIPINTSIVWDEGGDDDYETCSSSCMEVDDPPKSKKIYSEEEMNCMRREWEIKVDRSMRSQMKTQKEKERLEQEKQQMEEERREQIARLHKEKQRVEQEKQRVEQEKQRVEQEKQEQITRFHEERRVREDELEELRSRLEDLELEYQRERIAKVDQQNTSSASFSSATDIRTQSILCCAEQYGIKRLESVLLVRMRVTDPETNIETMQIYAFRRQFFSLVATVGEHLPNIVEFLCWFVTDNSVQDFNRCKDSIRNNQSAQKHITLTQNTISLTRQQQKQTTTTAAAALDDVVETAKKVMQLAGLLEADVNVLRRLFDNNSSSSSSSSSSNASQSNDDDDDDGDDNSNDDPRVRAVLERAYRWIRDAYTEYTTKGRRALMHTGRTRRH